MKKLWMLALLPVMLLVSACNDRVTPESIKEEERPGGDQANRYTGKTYGEKFNPSGPMDAGELDRRMIDTSYMPDVKVVGTVVQVCKVEDCWVKIGLNRGRRMHVVSQNNSFTLPQDLTGRVVLIGDARRSETSVEQLKDYAEQEGASQEEIDAIKEPRQEITFTARGVYVL